MTSINGETGKNGFKLRLDYEVTKQNTADNKSTVHMVLYLYAIDGNGGHFHGVGIELMSRLHAAGPVDCGLVGRNVLPAALPFHPKV